MAGRPRTPTALKVLDGNPGRRRLPNEPQPRAGARPPGWLQLAARSEWDKLAPMLERLGVLTETDAEALAELCTARARLHGQVKEGKFSTDLWRTIMAMETKFGLTPADRSRVDVKRGEPGDGWA